MTDHKTTESGWTVGSLADEAIQLLDAARRWVDHQQHERNQTSPTADGEDASDACKFCPVCQLIAALKKTSPEAVDQFARTTETLIASLRSSIVSREQEWKQPKPTDTVDIKIETVD